MKVKIVDISEETRVKVRGKLRANRTVEFRILDEKDPLYNQRLFVTVWYDPERDMTIDDVKKYIKLAYEDAIKRLQERKHPLCNRILDI